MAVKAASDVKYELAPEGARDYAPLLGIFGLVAYIYNRATLNAPQLLKFVAWYQVLVAAIAVRGPVTNCSAGSALASRPDTSGCRRSTSEQPLARHAWRHRSSASACLTAYKSFCRLVIWYSIAVADWRCVTSPLQLLFRRAELDNLSSVVAPAILAVYSLNLQQVTYMDAAVALFGCVPIAACPVRYSTPLLP